MVIHKLTTASREKGSHYVMMKESIQQKDIKIINVYTPNIKIPKFINQILAGLKGEIHSNTIRVGNFNTPLSIMKSIQTGNQ